MFPGPSWNLPISPIPKTVTPPDAGSEAWWERHVQEAFEIAKELQAALGSEVAVMLHRPEGWMTVDQIVRAEGGES